MNLKHFPLVGYLYKLALESQQPQYIHMPLMMPLTVFAPLYGTFQLEGNLQYGLNKWSVVAFLSLCIQSLLHESENASVTG